ncbi:MAG: hypothetical protein K2W82_09340 [Candidatus Obscuribacterales bacterium]|nr:hypothetical protein [Candidatus Obscuribacterales bacterium]
MFFKRNHAKSSQSEPGHIFPAPKKPVLPELSRKVSDWAQDQRILFDAICLALSIHVLALPFFWFIGWALPWPKSPIITTIIEINLENWPNEAIPEKITDIRKSNMHKYEK